MERPSIAMRPRAYKDGKVYSVLPINGAADLDFTRATSATSFNATRVENDNEIQEVASNTPRLDYSGNGCPSLLLEPESTNLITYSEPTTDENSSGGVTYESFDWGINFSNCVRFGDNLTTGWWYGGTVETGKEYTLSCYVIMDDLSEPVPSPNTSSGDFSVIIGGSLVADINNITVTNVTGNIWRVSAKRIATINLNNNGIAKYENQSAKGFRVVGWQLEELSYATSYIPTSGAIETRVAETLSKDSISDYINSYKGVLYVEIKALDNKSPFKVISISEGGDVNKRITLGFKGDTTAFYYKDSSSNNLILSSTDVFSYNKIAIKYDNQEVKFFLNGELINTDSKQLDIDFNSIHFNAGDTNTESFYGNIKDLRVYTTALTDEELTQLTS